MTNLSFILFGLTGLLGAAVSVHHLLRGPCPVRQPQFLPSSAVPAAAPPACAVQNGDAAQHSGAATGGRGATGAVHPTVNGVARAAGDSGATWHAEAGAGAGQAVSGGFRDTQPPGAHKGAERAGAVRGADVRSAEGTDWPVYEVGPSCELLGQGCRQSARAPSC